jgi:hypothetical protein
VSREGGQASLNFHRWQRVHFRFDPPQVIDGSLHGIAFVTVDRLSGIGPPAFWAEKLQVTRERQIRNREFTTAPLALVNEIHGFRLSSSPGARPVHTWLDTRRRKP